MGNLLEVIALLDGDIIAYQAATASISKIDWEDGEGEQISVDLEGAIDIACTMIEEWTRAANYGRSKARPYVCFSGRTGFNYRKHIDPKFYKAHRKDKPEAYWQIVDEIETRFKYFRVEGLEADDLMGIAGTDTARWGKTVIVSIDKDMNTIPGWVFNPSKDHQPTLIHRTTADYNWMTQTLTGDTCDGYKGCPRIGPVKAKKILDATTGTISSMWPAVVETFEAADLTQDDAILQARLARILRCGDYDRDKKEIKLWHPTKPELLALSGMTY